MWRAGVLCMVSVAVASRLLESDSSLQPSNLTCLSASTTIHPQPLQEQHLQVENYSELQIRDNDKWETRDVLSSMRERGVGGRDI